MLRRAAAALDEIAAEPGQLRLVDLGERLGTGQVDGSPPAGRPGRGRFGQCRFADGRFSPRASDCWDSAAPTGAHIAAMFRPTIEKVAAVTEEKPSTCRCCAASGCGSSTRSNPRTGCGRFRRSESGFRWPAQPTARRHWRRSAMWRRTSRYPGSSAHEADALRREIS